MDAKSFAYMPGFKSGDEVTVDAVILQNILKEQYSKDDVITDLKNKLENCYNRNDELFQELVTKSEEIKNLKKALAEVEEIASKTRRLKDENKKLSDNLGLANMFLERRRERERYEPRNMKVDLRA